MIKFPEDPILFEELSSIFSKDNEIFNSSCKQLLDPPYNVGFDYYLYNIRSLVISGNIAAASYRDHYTKICDYAQAYYPELYEIDILEGHAIEVFFVQMLLITCPSILNYFNKAAILQEPSLDTTYETGGC